MRDGGGGGGLDLLHGGAGTKVRSQWLQGGVGDYMYRFGSHLGIVLGQNDNIVRWFKRSLSDMFQTAPCFDWPGCVTPYNQRDTITMLSLPDNNDDLIE